MKLKTRPDEFLSSDLEMLSARNDSEPSTTSDTDWNEPLRQAWQRFIDTMLYDWGSNPEQFDDEGTEPPSRSTLVRAIQFAKQQRDRGEALPDSLVVDANGGIVFEWRQQDGSDVVYIWHNGNSEYQRFQGTRLVERSPL